MLLIAVQLTILLILIYIIILLTYSMARGAPYAALGKERTRTMFELLKPKKGEKLADLGSGDGRIVIYASKLGLDAVGYEINPLLYFLSIRNIRKKKSKKAKIYFRDYWNVDFSSFKYITLYGAPPMMLQLEKKLQKELKPGSKVVSNHFKFPNWKHTQELNDVYLYVVK